MGKLQQQLRQRKPFRGPSQEAFINLLRTADVLQRQLELALKPHGLTATQYNVLRILRGSGEPLMCSQVGERMIAHDPDITRLIDRMEKAALVARERSTHDRRCVLLSITQQGLAVLKELDGPVDELDDRLMSHMPKAEIAELSRLLEKLREPLESQPL